MNKCKIEGCSSPRAHSGFCLLHWSAYHKERRHKRKRQVSETKTILTVDPGDVRDPDAVVLAWGIAFEMEKAQEYLKREGANFVRDVRRFKHQWLTARLGEDVVGPFTER